MDSASCSILRAQPFSSAAAIFPPSNNTTAGFFALPKNNRNPNLVSLFSSTFPRNPNFPGKCLHFNRFSAFSSLCGARDQSPSQELAVLLEVEGVLIDAYLLGNRQSFNAAFKKLGHLCTNWTEPVYLDLLRKSAGDEEKMVNFYFNQIGWPSSLLTTEKESFVKNVLQKKKIAMDEFLMSESLTLRPGVEEFIDDAYKEGVPVVILTTYSKSGNQIARSIVEKLGEERVSKLKIVGDKEVLQSLFNQLVNDIAISSGMDEQLSKEAIKAVSAEKERIFKELALLLKLILDIDTRPPESLEKIILALQAGAEVAGLPVCDCVLIAGSQSGVAGAERVGMPCVVLRSSLTARAEFPSANAIMDGFGGAELTIPKLRNKGRSIVEKLGQERVSKLKIVGDKEVEQSLYSQLVNDTGLSSGMDEQLAKEAIKSVSAEKQRIAEEVASLLKLSVDIDTSPSESLEKIIAALRAGAEVAGLPVCDCVLIAGSQSGVAGAERVGMPCVVLRSSLTARAEFPSANAIMDGFGGADLTIPKLLNKRRS